MKGCLTACVVVVDEGELTCGLFAGAKWMPDPRHVGKPEGDPNPVLGLAG